MNKIKPNTNPAQMFAIKHPTIVENTPTSKAAPILELSLLLSDILEILFLLL